MKKVKCYGGKNYKLVESSFNRAFFGNKSPSFNFNNENFLFEQSKSQSPETSNQSLGPLFNSFEKLRGEKIIQKKLPTKYKIPFKRFPKYKGKRKFKIVKKSFKENNKKNMPSFSCFENYELIVEYNINAPAQNSDNHNKKNHSNVGNIINLRVESTSENILSSSLENMHLDNNIYNARQSKSFDNALHETSASPVTNNFSKDSFCKSNVIPITSTPIGCKKKFHPKCPMSTSPISVFYSSQQKRNNFFEHSFSSQISVTNKPTGKKLILQEESFKETKCKKKTECVRKSYSNIEKSIFLKSSSCLKEAPATSFDQLSVLPKLLELCDQKEVISFNKVFDWRKTTLRKVGEGSYGEVFMLTVSKKSIIIKVIPISEEFGNNLQSVESVYSEIKVLHVLNELRYNKNFQTKNFNLLKKVHVVKGNYPDKMLQAWDIYAEIKTTCNDRPGVFEGKQIFAILELEYGGKDMSSFMLRNSVEAESVFKQTAISLAIAEDTNLFEHRDLHLGNILVQRIRSKKISYIFRGKPFSIPSEGLLVTIIDFTLSRILHEGCVYYNDLADDESLFNQTGDIQFEIYKATKNELKNRWHECLLYSNVLWLNFLCKKFDEHEYGRPSTVKHKKGLQNLKVISQKLETCKSSLDCLDVCNILPFIPDKIPGQDSKLSVETLFIDKKSFRSSLSLLN